MKNSHLLASLVLGGALITGSGLALNAAEPSRAEASTQNAQTQAWLSIPDVQERLTKAGYQHIEKISRDQGCYKVKATDAQGRRVKLYLHPVSGELLDKAQAKELKRLAKARPMAVQGK